MLRLLKNRMFGKRRGATMVELLVALTILGIAVLSMIASFSVIQRSLQGSKNKSLATNLVSEKMQVLKQQNYYAVLVTTDPVYDTAFTPSVPYDTGYFPAEVPLIEGSVVFTRYTYIQVAKEDSGAIVTLSPSTADTGLKLITITVKWSESGSPRKISMSSVLGNPDTVTANAIFTGKITDSSTSNAIENALVNAAENQGWRDLSNASGDYEINVSPGVYSLVATAKGYFRQIATVGVAAEQSVTTNFALDPMDTGNIEGYAWYNPDLVISGVVAGTSTICGDQAVHEVEFVTLFNPTTHAINIGETGLSSNKNVNIGYLDESSSRDHTDSDFNFVHVTTYVPSRHTYLIANATYFYFDGQWRTADAYYQPTPVACGSALYCNVIYDHYAAGIELTRASNGDEIDKVGWDDADNGAPTNEGTSLDLASTDGLAIGAQIVRISTPADSATLLELKSFGHAYDSGDNADDFSFRNPADLGPLSTADGAMPIITGKPALGALVSASDGLSDPTTAYNPSGDVPVAYFNLTNVATGTWVAIIAKDGYGLETSSIAIPTSGSSYIFGSSATFLESAVTQGFVTGEVSDIFGAPISPAISVSPGSAGDDQDASTTDGDYFLRVEPGTIEVTANPGNANPDYVSQTVSIEVEQGEIVNEIDFILSQGGRVTGFVTRDGSNALPGIAVAVKDGNGIAQDQQVSDINGLFTSANVATGTYTVEPILDSLESSSPETASVTISIGSTVDAGTFTITGALGSITGSVTSNGDPVTTGALVVVSVDSLSGSPPEIPTISSSSLTGNPYYMTSSLEDGTYNVETRQGSYTVYAYYTTVAKDGTVTIDSLSVSSVNVTAGQTTSGVNFAW